MDIPLSNLILHLPLNRRTIFGILILASRRNDTKRTLTLLLLIPALLSRATRTHCHGTCSTNPKLNTGMIKCHLPIMTLLPHTMANGVSQSNLPRRIASMSLRIITNRGPQPTFQCLCLKLRPTAGSQINRHTQLLWGLSCITQTSPTMTLSLYQWPQHRTHSPPVGYGLLQESCLNSACHPVTLCSTSQRGLHVATRSIFISDKPGQHRLKARARVRTSPSQTITCLRFARQPRQMKTTAMILTPQSSIYKCRQTKKDRNA